MINSGDHGVEAQLEVPSAPSRPSRFPADCLSADEAIGRIGAARHGADWQPFCPLCLDRALRGQGLSPRRWPARYGLALAVALPLAGTGWGMISSFAKIADERYITARLTFALLAAACAAVLAVYGVAGIARRRGWFHRHPPPSAEAVDRWRAVLDEIADAVAAGRVRAFALSLDGDLTAIDGKALPRPVLLAALGGADANAAWTALARFLLLRNAPSGALVLARDDIDRLCAACESG